jgi:mRNA interferase MazF
VKKRVGSDALAVGDIIVATLPGQVPPGREQQGYRPVIVVGVPEALGTLRYPMLLVIPLTTYRGQQWAIASPNLYPVLEAGEGALPTSSIALLDQMRSLDKTRVSRYIGTLTHEQYQPILNGLSKMINPAKLG